jgi:hypothetical protein
MSIPISALALAHVVAIYWAKTIAKPSQSQS